VFLELIDLIMSSSPTFLDPIIIPLIVGDSVLDVGCGYGRWGNLIRSNYWEAGMTRPPDVDGIDAFQPNVELCSQNKCYSHVWHQVMPSKLNRTWDTVLACEFIEHLEQDRAEEVIDILEKAAKKRIIFSTPNWPAYRGGGDTIVGYNDYEAHLSYFSRNFFRGRGYKLIGAGFGNPTNLFTRVIQKSLRELKLFHVLYALESLPRIVPTLANSIVAYKDMD
jgi:2-polyprenyl-3-methyl-5-hydroxy-6-metoxy-1,4-benzoquinol methylase